MKTEKREVKMAESELQMLENERQEDPSFAFVDSLFCQEEHWEGELRDDCFFRERGSYYACINGIADNDISKTGNPGCPICQILRDQELFWEEHELSTMLYKEGEHRLYQAFQTDPLLASARREAVEWMLKVHAHFSFSLRTAVLAVNYLDRFLLGFKFQTGKPWLTQLTAVACLSLAAKIEETYVPLLLDLQVEETKYLFEAKTIKRMEILVLSTLEWKMNPVTPYSFLDYMIRRLGLKNHLCWEFLRRCEIVLLATLPDSRFMCYLPSVVAAATMLHAINNAKPCIEEYCKSQILAILGINKDKAEDCGQLIIELKVSGNILFKSTKRKSVSMPGSPNGVMDVSFSSDRSNDSWAVASSSASSSPEPLPKKMRVDQDHHLERFKHPSAESSSIPR